MHYPDEKLGLNCFQNMDLFEHLVSDWLASSALLCWWLWLHHYNITPWKMNGSNSCGLITTYTHIDRHTHRFLDMDSCPRIITSHILLVKANPLSLRLNSFWHRLVCSHFNPMWNLIGFACSLHPGNIDCENPNMHKQVPIVEKKPMKMIILKWKWLISK